MLTVACNGASTEDTGTEADDTASSENQTQMVAGDSMWTYTTDPHGQNLLADEMNLALPISMTGEGDNCSDITDYLTLPCTVEIDITATRSAE